MVSKPLLSVLMTLVIVAQLGNSYRLSTTIKPTTKPGRSYLYIFGGGLDSQTATNYTSRLSPTGEWERMADLPEERTWSCGAVIGKKIYLFGGRKSMHPPKYSLEYASNVVYDILTNTYRSLPPLPDFNRVYCTAAALNGIIYIGGIADFRGDYSYTPLIRFDTRTNQWLTPSKSTMEKSRRGYHLVEIAGRLYGIGGAGTSSYLTEIYNATTDKWSRNSLQNYPLGQYGSVAVHDGKIYAFERGTSFPLFEAFDPNLYFADLTRLKKWTMLTAPKDDFGGGNGRKLVSLNGKLLAVGGRSGLEYENFHSYDPSTDQWRKEQKIDFPRYEGHSTFVVDL